MEANNNQYGVQYNLIKRETEKAICLECRVSWGNGGNHVKELWFPKSQVTEMDKKQNIAYVNCWFVNKVEEQNSFHGYLMTIEKFNAWSE